MLSNSSNYFEEGGRLNIFEFTELSLKAHQQNVTPLYFNHGKEINKSSLEDYQFHKRLA